MGIGCGGGEVKEGSNEEFGTRWNGDGLSKWPDFQANKL